MGILDAAIQTEAAGRRMSVRGVAGQEGVADAEPAGDDTLVLPVADGVQVDRMVRLQAEQHSRARAMSVSSSWAGGSPGRGVNAMIHSGEVRS